MTPLFSILICHNPVHEWRKETLKRLLTNLHRQTEGIEEAVEILIDDEEGSIGAKRNRLLEKANGKSVAFVDDDDNVSANYLDLLIPGIQTEADCCSLRGIIDERGVSTVFEHSIRHDIYLCVAPENNDGVKYLRFPNHLNCIKSAIAKQFKFPEINHGEDTDWATQLHKARVLNSEYWIGPPLYYYNPSSNRK